ncbi:hypothetical protein, conserved [Eimeria praecox]|uniref:Uncharacterized protein n=1 Tax=Eimeria praecox TaxID=51316 RepID=U6H8B6_9EIME|nr:hypothetical protein, conserved [Eimeria praecox]
MPHPEAGSRGHRPENPVEPDRSAKAQVSQVAQLFARLQQEIEEACPRNAIHFIVDFLCKHYPEHLKGFASVWNADPELESERLLVVEFFKAQKLPTDVASHFTNAGFDTLETLCTLTAESLDDIEKFNQTRWLPGHKVRLQQTFADIAGRVRAFTEERDYLIRAASGYCPHPQLRWVQPLLRKWPMLIYQSMLWLIAVLHELDYASCTAGLEGSYSWVTDNNNKRLSTRVVLTDQRAIRTKTPTRRRWSYLVVTLPNSSLQIGTWTMVYDEGFEQSGRSRMQEKNEWWEDQIPSQQTNIQLNVLMLMASRGPQETRRTSLGAQEKDQPENIEASFVMSGHDYRLPVLPVSSRDPLSSSLQQ